MKPKEIIIYGAGGFARESAWLIQSCNETSKRYDICCFIDESPAQQGLVLNGIQVLSLAAAFNRFPSATVVTALGNPQRRELAVKRIEADGFTFETVVHPRAEMSALIKLGMGTVICAGNILTTNITLGKHVHVNLNCTIGHDVVIGDFTTLAPGVHVSGRVRIGNRVYIGTGAVIIDGSWEKPLIIEDDVVVGAGACVTKSLNANMTYVGVPAKAMMTDGAASMEINNSKE